MKNRHWLMMGICVVGMGAVLALALPSVRASIGGRVGGGGSWVWLMAVLCPLSHIFMLRGMHHGQDGASGQGGAGCHGKHNSAGDSSKQPEAPSNQA